MIGVIKDNLIEIEKTCKEMQVKSLFLIGSASRKNDFTKDSDLDFVFRFKLDEKGYPLTSYDYFDFLFKLEEIKGKKVDLIAEEKIKNKYFLNKIKEEKICIYES